MLQVLKLSKEDVTNWANSAIPDEYDPSLARPVQGADGEKKNVVNTAKVLAAVTSRDDTQRGC